MPSEAGMEEYLSEIVRLVCACVERPEGGPPCGPLGKWCGVEYRLPDLIDAVHDAHGRWMGPYSDSTERHVCEHCPARDGMPAPAPWTSCWSSWCRRWRPWMRGGRGVDALRVAAALPGRQKLLLFNVSSGPTTRRPGPGRLRLADAVRPGGVKS